MEEFMKPTYQIKQVDMEGKPDTETIMSKASDDFSVKFA